MRVLITGGSGFVGQAVARQLRKWNFTITILDIHPPAVRPDRFIQGSVLCRSTVDAALQGQDFVVHAAACVGVESCFADPHKVEQVNVVGTHNVIASASQCSLKGLLFVSSSEIYGDGHASPFNENDIPFPRTLYGHTKLAGEDALRRYAGASSHTSTVVRLFNVYGPYQRDEFVIPRFLQQATDGASITIYGDGTQVRSFTFVDDAALGICQALIRANDDSAKYEVFNIGRPEPVTIGHLALTIKSVIDSSSEIINVPLVKSSRKPSEEIFHRIPDVVKAAARLGFTATTSLEEGLANTVRASNTHIAGYATDSLD